ncbi:MAG TPA: M1 family metallopeptidase [Burkholderiaceae bacterium]|nr:M1 family metallopeptidase [Burkholderiaceae bacterium]
MYFELCGKISIRLSAAVALLVWVTAVSAARFDFDATPGRLPKDIVPSHYALAFELDPAEPTFRGSTAIDVVVRRPVREIVLQALALTPRSATLSSEAATPQTLDVTRDQDNNLLRLRLPSGEPVAPGRWRVAIDYDGKIARRAEGLYLVEYKSGSGAGTIDRRMLATQLEPAHARALFPSFDEPSFRATFDISITAPGRFEAVSNMPVRATALLPDGRRLTTFSRTPSMPTYLVALSVGEFDMLSDSYDGIALRILTTPGRAAEAGYAMEVTKQVLAYYGDYFGLRYMLPKLDQLAIPGVRGGAMEDWGAISYNEGLLLFDAARSPPRLKERIYWVVAHEIAHQWFGNLVTAAWWDDIWLNEAFATWMANKALARFNPEWDSQVRGRLFREGAFTLDARNGTRAIADPPSHESRIQDVFDEITYDKGGAVLGMFESLIGEDTFRDGLRRYMAGHPYSNATAEDLWFHLSQAAGRNLSPQIGGWISQRGFPLVTVRTVCAGGRTQVAISQQRYSSGSAAQPASTWAVPVVIHGGREVRRLVLGDEPKTLELDGCVPVVANGGDVGYYRVQYDPDNMARLRASYSTLPATERIGLVADTMALARAGRLEFAEYFELLRSVRAEREGAIWQQVIEGLRFLDDALAGTSAQAALRQYARGLLNPPLARLTWTPLPTDNAGTMRLRDNLIDALGRFDDASTVAHARVLFAAFKATPSTPIEASIRSGVVGTVARHADAATFSEVRKLLDASSNQEEEYLYGDAMIQVRDPQLVQLVLQAALTDEWKPGPASWYVRQIGEASGHPALAPDFILANFDAVLAKSSRDGRAWVLPVAYTGFNATKDADGLLSEQRQRLGVEAMQPAQQIAELIREKAAVREREASRLEAVLSAAQAR